MRNLAHSHAHSIRTARTLSRKRAHRDPTCSYFFSRTAPQHDCPAAASSSPETKQYKMRTPARRKDSVAKQAHQEPLTLLLREPPHLDLLRLTCPADCPGFLKPRAITHGRDVPEPTARSTKHTTLTHRPKREDHTHTHTHTVRSYTLGRVCLVAQAMAPSAQ